MTNQEKIKEAIGSAEGFRPNGKETLAKVEWEKIAKYILNGPAKKLLNRKFDEFYFKELMKAIACVEEKERDSVVDFIATGPAKYFLDKKKNNASHLICSFSLLSSDKERKEIIKFCRKFLMPNQYCSHALLEKAISMSAEERKKFEWENTIFLCV